MTPAWLRSLGTRAFTHALAAAALASAAGAASFVQDDWTGGAIAGSSTTLAAGQKVYDSDDGNLTALSTGVLTRQNLPRTWLQTDDGLGESGFARAGSQFSSTTVLGTGADARVALLLFTTVTARAAAFPQRGYFPAAYHPGTARTYLFGGRNGGSFTNQILSYNSAADSVATLGTTLPGSRAGSAAVYHPGRDRIYVFGGVDSGGIGLAEILEFNPSGPSIVTKSAILPTGRSLVGAAYHPGTDRIYILGGFSDFTQSFTAQILAYDATADQITVKSASLPSARGAAGAGYDPQTDQIYLFGGNAAGVFLDEIAAYDPDADSVAVKSAVLPSTRAGVAAARHGDFGKFYLFGGSAPFSLSSDILEYDALADTLAVRAAALPSSRAYSGAAYDDGAGLLFVFGAGEGPAAAKDDALEFRLVSTGSFVSSAFYAGNPSSFTSLSWEPAAPFGSSVTLTLGFRAGDTASPDASWTNGGQFVTVANGGSLAAFGVHRYAQFIATFTTTNLSTSAVLESATLSFLQTAASASLVSSAFDSGQALNSIRDIRWQGAFPAGTTAYFQIRTASDAGNGFPAAFGPFLGPTGTGDFYSAPGGSNAIHPQFSDADADRWFQYRMIVVSSDTTLSPRVATVTVSFDALPASPTITGAVALSTVDVQVQWTDASTIEDEFVLSSGAVNCTVSTGPSVATLDKPGAGGTQTGVIGGFTPNSINAVCLRARSLSPPLFSLYSSSRIVFTLANPPVSLAIASVFVSSLSLSWGENGNSSITTYEVSLSTDGFVAHFSTPVPFAANLLNGATVISGLAAGTTYYLRVRAQNGAAIPTAFASVVSTETPPAPLTGLAGAALGVSSISWTWNDSGPSVSYRVFSASAGVALATAAAPGFVSVGLGTNAPAGLRVEPFNNFASAGLSAPATVFTLALPPASPAAVAAASTTLSLAWSANTNPPGTLFELSLSTDSFGQSISTPVPFAAGLTAAATTLSALEAAATYYFRVRAQNGDAFATAFSATGSTFTLPGGLPAPTPSVLGVASITWTWSNTAGTAVAGYAVYRASSGALLATVSAPVFTELALATNTAHGLRVAAVNGTGQGALSAAATAFTLAAPPAGTAATGVFRSSISLSWDARGNPPSTTYALERSTDNAAFSALVSVTTNAHADTGLVGLTTYYYRVRAQNGDGVFTAFDAALQVFFFGDPPLAPGGLSAEPAAGARILLGWTISPSSGVVRYSLYFDNGTGTVDYAVLLASVAHPTTSFLTAPLTPGTTYLFGLRARDALGVEETNGFVLASAVAQAAAPALSAAIRSPPAGRRVAGDRVTVSASRLSGSAQPARVRFQLRAFGSGPFADIPAASSGRPNPATAEPFAIHWDVSALALGLFELRAVAEDAAGAADPFPPAVAVFVDPAGFDQQDSDQGAGRLLTRLRVHNGGPSAVTIADLGSAVLTDIALSSGSLDGEQTFLRVVTNPAGVPGAPPALAPAGIYREVSLESGQSALAGGRLARLSFSRLDRDGNRRVDGTAVRVDALAVYYFDAAGGGWRRDFASEAGADGDGTVTALSPHFTTFGLFAAAATDFSRARVYPVPFKPNDGIDDTGKPYSAGDPNSGILFDNLVDKSRVRIYTVAGSLVWESPPEILGGALQWDVRNGDGREVASGVYYAVISGPGNAPIVRKLVVIR